MVIELLATGQKIDIKSAYVKSELRKGALDVFQIDIVSKDGILHEIDLKKVEHKWHPQTPTDHLCCDNLLVLNDGTEIVGAHEQDCYEYNYADMAALEDTTFFDQVRTKQDLFFGSSEYGVIIGGHFVPCYSYQNGYYTDKISIYVDGEPAMVDITALWKVEDLL